MEAIKTPIEGHVVDDGDLKPMLAYDATEDPELRINNEETEAFGAVYQNTITAGSWLNKTAEEILTDVNVAFARMAGRAGVPRSLPL